jgi:nicotinate phosphoribosyltransferase
MENESPLNSLVTPLLTDLYQLTMAYGYWKSNRHNERAVFELFFRKNPFKGAFTIFCGLDEVVKFLANFKFSKSDIEYLKSTPSLGRCDPEFFDDYLAELDCSEVTVKSLPHGSVAFPRVPLLIVSGPLGITQLLETTLLNLINFPSLIATNAARMVIAARGQNEDRMIRGKIPKCVEFGLRRAQGPDGGMSASKYSYVGGFDGTANVLAGKLCDLPIAGTHAHSFVQSYSSLDEVEGITVKKKGSEEEIELLPIVLKYRKQFGGDWLRTNDGELAAFIGYGCCFPHAFLCLVDTYDTIESGVKNFVIAALALYECGYNPIGIRLDSGDLAGLSMECDQVFEEVANKFQLPFFRNLEIVASNNINEKTLEEFNVRGHGITMFGIGTNLVTCQSQPALGCVYKLVEINGKPKIKLSNEIAKVLIPGQKDAYRLYGEKTYPVLDVMIESEVDEVPTAGVAGLYRHPFSKEESISITPSRVEKLHTTFWDRNRGLTTPIPSLKETRSVSFLGFEGI